MHRIEFVDDDVLPAGHDFLLLMCEGGARLFYRRSQVTPENLEDSWAAYRAVRAQRPKSPDAQPEVQRSRLSLVSAIASVS